MTGQRRNIRSNKWLHSNITGFGQQHRANTDRQALHSCTFLTYMSKFICKPCMGINLKKKLSQVDNRKQARNAFRERLQRG
jgi:hypothetical protein